MKTFRSIFVATLAVGAIISLPAHAQSTACNVQVSCQLPVSQNLAVDSDFEIGCPAWVFGIGSKREYPGPCGSTYCPDHDALMTTGGTSTATYFQQDINLAPSGCRLNPYRLTFLIHVRSSSPSTWDKVTVEVLNPSTGALLQTLAVYDSRTQYTWEPQQLDLSSASSTWPQWVRLRFRGTFANSSSPAQFRFDQVKFWGI